MIIKVRVTFDLVNGEDRYPGNLCLDVPEELVHGMKDVDILVEESVKNMFSSEIDITNMEVIEDRC